MKIVVRQVGTGLYLASNGAWGQRASAREFPSVEAAGLEALRFEKADVVLSYDDPPCELALNPAFCLTAPPPTRARKTASQ
jgi:hypothetical protein